MEEIVLSTWEQFEKKLAELEDLQSQRRSEKDTNVSDILFRGQAQSSWKLDTTLDRWTDKEIRVLEYFDVIHNMMPEVEAFTDRRWETPNSVTEYAKLLQGKDIITAILSAYEYMAHLRHHGFPSPLLDWTTSPYIAAYFAFKDATSEQESVALYAYLEYAGQSKVGRLDEPSILSLGPIVRTHPRHFLQKSQYTICSRYDDTDHWFASHECVFERDNADQDLLWKFILPTSERRKVLRFLERFNIKAFSLFGSEESLMESLAIREFVIERRYRKLFRSAV